MIQDLKSKLGGLEQNLESANTRKKALTEKLATTETLGNDTEGTLEKLQKMHSLWIDELVDTVERLSSQLAIMDMKS